MDEFSDSDSDSDSEDDSESNGGEEDTSAPTPEETTRLYPPSAPLTNSIPYRLTLRATIPSLLPSMEFRAFVRHRSLLCICQRDQNYYAFLTQLAPLLRSLIQDFFDANLKSTFPDENFVFDVYIPRPEEGDGDGKRGRVWLIDINPWAERTGTGIYEWLEILRMDGPPGDLEPLGEEDAGEDLGEASDGELEEGAMRISIRGHDRGAILDVDGGSESDDAGSVAHICSNDDEEAE